MNEKMAKNPRWRPATGILLVLLMVGFLVGLSVLADDPLPGTDGTPVQYEIKWTGIEGDRLEVELPDGFEYVGLAAGSQVGIEPEISSDGRWMIWYGPVPGAEVLRFWIAPKQPLEAPTNLTILGTDVQAYLAEPITAPEVDGEMPAGPLAETATVAKTVEVKPDWPNNLWVTYEAVFDNQGPGTATLDRITDTLPTDFLFGGMAYGSDVAEAPTDAGDNRWVWEDISFSGTLTLRYHVRAVGRIGVYQNSVEAVAGNQQIGPASATLELEGTVVYLPAVFRNYSPPMPVWQVSKTASPTELDEPGDPVDYTVVVANVGDHTGILTKFADTLPGDFTFDTMLPGSDVADPPSGTTGRVTWNGVWTVDPGEDVTLVYRVVSGGSGKKVNTFRAYTFGSMEVGAASSTVSLSPGLPFEDEFSTELPEWEPFTNWPDLSPDHWEWSGDPGVWGIWSYDWEHPEPYTGYNLMIWDAPGAQDWTDYRVEVRFKDAKATGDLRRGLVGVFFRGTYEDTGGLNGKTVGGYYVYMKVAEDILYLMRTPPTNLSFGAQETKATYKDSHLGRGRWYKLVVEVRGANIKAWFEDDQDGVSNPVQVFNWTDPGPVWSSGTVGLATHYTTARFDYIRVLPLD
jgi:uncharacterized repeat protein (TIGR01451 family)